MTSRWIMAVAASGAIALLTVPLLLSRPASTATTDQVRQAPQAGGSCKAESKADFKFVLKDMNGAPLKLADYKGKVVLLNFWGTWCGPCQLEIPEFIEIQNKYRDKGFTILGLAVEDTPEDVRSYSSKAKMNYPLAMIQDDVEEAFGPIVGLPMSYFISRDGSICKKHFGPLSKEAAEKEIKALL